MRSILDGVVAHFLAEALLNAPLVIGSLQLFFNPTGLVRSIQRGVADMIDLPMQGLQRGGALEFLAGVGHGSVSLVREVSGEHQTIYASHTWGLLTSTFVLYRMEYVFYRGIFKSGLQRAFQAELLH